MTLTRRTTSRAVTLLGAGTIAAIVALSACSTSAVTTAPPAKPKTSATATTGPSTQPQQTAPPSDEPASDGPASDGPTSETPAAPSTAPDAPDAPVATSPANPIEIKPAAAVYVPPAPASIDALDTALVAVGKSDGQETVRIQERLLELGFWLQGADGDFGLTTTQAVMAFQKYHGISATGSVDDQTATMMSAAADRANGRGDAGTFVEIDKSRQLLSIVVDGSTTWTFNTSTGTEVPYETVNDKDPTKVERGDSVTPVGLFHTERERPVGWWAGDLGEIYRPKYFIGGIAVHGSNSIPNYPASHGCVRVSVPAMDFLWDTNAIPLGTNVWVHGEIPTT